MSASTLGGIKAPSHRRFELRTPNRWLRCKVIDDDIGDAKLWRIHDKLYDLSDYAVSNLFLHWPVVADPEAGVATVLHFRLHALFPCLRHSTGSQDDLFTMIRYIIVLI